MPCRHNLQPQGVWAEADGPWSPSRERQLGNAGRAGPGGSSLLAGCVRALRRKLQCAFPLPA